MSHRINAYSGLLPAGFLFPFVPANVFADPNAGSAANVIKILYFFRYSQGVPYIHLRYFQIFFR